MIHITGVFTWPANGQTTEFNSPYWYLFYCYWDSTSCETKIKTNNNCIDCIEISKQRLTTFQYILTSILCKKKIDFSTLL